MNQMKKLNKLSLLNILLILVYFMTFTNISLVYGAVTKSDYLKISIGNVKEFMEFANNCYLDTYSKKKNFVLTQDIDLTECDFTPIPIFSGIFDGNGHTIKGVNIHGSGSNLALFRYLQESGTIKNLKVTGDIHPEGTGKNIGGIVGNNRGRILNCEFYGTVSGKESAGGIVGVNNSSGYISKCISSALVTAEKITGGIAGSNHGIIIQSTNRGSINIFTKDTSQNLNSMKLNEISSEDLIKNTDDEVIKHTDSGGIAGFSDGIVQSCENSGGIGYQHVGYNVGGIIGRQSGYVRNCKNYGKVLGRKDVGGVVGQMEPYLQIKFSEDILQKLDKELNSLTNYIDKTLDDTDRASQSTTDRLSTLNSLTDKASKELHEVINQTTDFTDETVSAFNEISFRISTVLEEMEVIFDDFDNAAQNMTYGLNEISEAFSHLKELSSHLTDATKDFEYAFQDLASSINEMNKAMKKIEKANELLKDNLGNAEKIEDAKNDLNDSVDDFQRAANDMTNAVNIIADILGKFNELYGIDWEQVSQDLRSCSTSFSENIENALKELRRGISTLSDVAEDDIKTLKEVHGILSESFILLETSSSYFEGFVHYFCDALYDIEDATEHSEAAMENMREGLHLLSISSEYINSAVKKADEILEDLNSKPDIEFPKLGEKVNEPSDNFFAAFDEISKELDTINNESADSRKLIIKDIKEINNKMYNISEIIIDGRKKALEEPELYKDISDHTLYSTLDDENSITKGSVVKSFNNGNISGDINVGGVVGSIAVEYDFDPEGDIMKDKKSTLNFQYQTRAVLYKSVNKGKVTAKKDYSGGAAGRMDVGLLSKCENYGHVNSKDGDYVGGIAGLSSSTIENSYAKCMLSGRSYVGGITGQGENVYNCYTMVKISDAEEYIGSIAGDAKGQFKNNYFVSGDWAGIDNISYTEKAAPKDYDTFIQIESLPKEFKKFVLIFKAEDKIINSLEFNYGDSLYIDKLPSIPERKGYYSFWPEYDYDDLTFSDTLEAIYKPLITTIAVEESSPEIPSRLLAEGVFGPEAKVSLKESQDKPPIHNESEILIGNWTASLSVDIEESDFPVTLRYYYPNFEKNIKLMILNESEWSQVDFIVDGSYLVFKTLSKDTTFCILKMPSNNLYIYISTGLFIILIVLFIFFKRKKKNDTFCKIIE